MNILISKIESSVSLLKEVFNNYKFNNLNVVIMPLAFKEELNKNKFNDDYFNKGGKRYNKYYNALIEIGFSNIKVVNPYVDKENIEKILNTADVIVLPGGNPEMLYQKIVQDLCLSDFFKKFDGDLIGESAGALIQFKKYFLTKENNYYNCFSFYPGLDLIKNNILADVHTINSEDYLSKLKETAINCKKDVYAIYDDGLIIVDKDIKVLGNVTILKAVEENL